MTLSQLLELGTVQERAAFEELPLGYLETSGTPRLREQPGAEPFSRSVVAVAGNAPGGGGCWHPACRSLWWLPDSVARRS
jgi:hypothetical protein